MKTIEDNRKIESIYRDGGYEDNWCYSIKEKYCDEIIPYHENGEMAPIVWFKLIKDGTIIHRINMQHTTGIKYVVD